MPPATRRDVTPAVADPQGEPPQFRQSRQPTPQRQPLLTANTPSLRTTPPRGEHFPRVVAVLSVQWQRVSAWAQLPYPELGLGSEGPPLGQCG